MNQNPYSPPMNDGATYMSAPVYAASAGMGVTELAVDLLRQTRPWVMLLSVMCFLGCAGVVGLGLILATVGMGFGSKFPPAVGLIYVPFGFLYVYPGLKLWVYAGAISRLVISRSTADLEAALSVQKSFWKFSGMSVIAMFVLYIVIFFVAIAAGLATVLLK